MPVSSRAPPAASPDAPPSSHLYWCLAVYAAINVPIGRGLSTPLTQPMLQATGSTLADSILLYASAPHLALVASVLAAAALLPPLVRRAPALVRHAGAGAALIGLATGPLFAVRLDTIGLHRNVLLALIDSLRPSISARAGDADWRTPPFDTPPGTDPSRLHGVAAGCIRHEMVEREEPALGQADVCGGVKIWTTFPSGSTHSQKRVPSQTHGSFACPPCARIAERSPSRSSVAKHNL